MLKYIIKRTFYAILTIWIVATLTFTLMYMVPGGPFLAEKTPSEATLAALNEKYGLDKPKIEQYKNYMVNFLQGDLGPSIKQRGRQVGQIISSGFAVSAKVGGIAILLAVCVGVPLGSISAFNRGKWLDNTIIIITTCGIAVPSFVVATVLMLILSVELNLLPTYGLTSWQNYIMPVMSIAFYPTAYITRLMRSSMLEVLGQDYMRTAKSKGLSQFWMLFKHALRNAILPVVTYLGPLLAYTLTGSFVVEKIFTVPGLGNEFISSIINRDYTMIMGTTIFLATLVILMNLLVDIIYKIVDPRIKLK
ncbi:MAG: ABC-type dipeptide/oligopeptide/nickel transport system, permease component [Clostridia bacterium]|jgi:oligopeptide transport system permease protein|nr:ABC-type dipeptide/oligopeptide/nickel transport system, permease component [Clostridia bacterium]